MILQQNPTFWTSNLNRRSPRGPPSLLTSLQTHRKPDADYPIMPDFKLTSNGIEKLLKGLNAHKAPGPDALSPRLLKELSSEIAPLLQLVYQKSLDTSCIPEDWCKANITPTKRDQRISQKTTTQSHLPRSAAR